MIISRLTTIDNEFDPFTQDEAWTNRELDETNLCHQLCYGKSSFQLLDDEAILSSDLPNEVNEEENSRAIDEVIKKYRMLGIFRKVQKEV